jgi:glycosyltransferase involved in cell wall biosynthesis
MSDWFPLVSIVIPVYNGSNFLCEAIDSALNQTYKNIEILVINDGSTDEDRTKKLALNYGDKIRYFEKENFGVSSALNFGLSKMRGEYFSWLSHDDFYDSKNIETQINILRKYPDKISVCKTGILIDSVYSKFSENHNIYIYNKPLDALNQWIYGCSLLIPKNVLVSIGGLNEANKTTQDVELIWKLLYNFELYFINTTLVYRRVHKDQGFQLEQEKNLEDLLNLVVKILNEFGVLFFLNMRESSFFKKIKTYFDLAWHFQKDKRDTQSKIPKIVLEYCLKDWPSSFNPSNIILKNLSIFRSIVLAFMNIKVNLSRIYQYLFNK